MMSDKKGRDAADMMCQKMNKGEQEMSKSEAR